MRSIHLGVLVPSSNRALEPLTSAIVDTISTPNLRVTVHYARFRVTKITLGDDANAQFTHEPMLEAARLLADAKVDVIGWSGTSAAWLGWESDDELCSAIQKATNIPATTSMTAMNGLLKKHKAVGVGLITPYTDDVVAAILKNYAQIGFPITNERSRNAGKWDNITFADLDEPYLDGLVEDVVKHGAKTVLVVCTNVGAAQRAKHWEDKYGIHVLDSVATVVVGMLQELNIGPNKAMVDHWGSVFRLISA